MKNRFSGSILMVCMFFAQTHVWAMEEKVFRFGGGESAGTPTPTSSKAFSPFNENDLFFFDPSQVEEKDSVENNKNDGKKLFEDMSEIVFKTPATPVQGSCGQGDVFDFQQNSVGLVANGISDSEFPDSLQGVDEFVEKKVETGYEADSEEEEEIEFEYEVDRDDFYENERKYVQDSGLMPSLVKFQDRGFEAPQEFEAPPSYYGYNGGMSEDQALERALEESCQKEGHSMENYGELEEMRAPSDVDTDEDQSLEEDLMRRAIWLSLQDGQKKNDDVEIDYVELGEVEPSEEYYKANPGEKKPEWQILTILDFVIAEEEDGCMFFDKDWNLVSWLPAEIKLILTLALERFCRLYKANELIRNHFIDRLGCDCIETAEHHLQKMLARIPDLQVNAFHGRCAQTVLDEFFKRHYLSLSLKR